MSHFPRFARNVRTGRSAVVSAIIVTALAAAAVPAAASPDRPFLGISSRSLRGQEARELGLETRDGAILERVYDGTAAAAAGLQRDDIIVEFDGEKVYDDSDLTELILARDAGETVSIAILREGKPMTVEVQLGSREAWNAEQGHDRPGWVQALESLFGGSERRGPYLGVEVMALNRQMRDSFDVDGGVMITRVLRKSTAETAGLRAGDIVVRVAGERVSEEDDIRDALDGRFGQTITVEVVRGGKRTERSVTLEQE